MSNSKITPTFCITGALDKMKRIDAIVMIHNKTNARWVSMVSKNTDYLISSRKDTNKAPFKTIRFIFLLASKI